MPGGGGQRRLHGLQTATIVDAALLASVLVVAAGLRRSSEANGDAPTAYELGRLGLELASIALPLALLFAIAQPSVAHRVALQDQHRANSRAVAMLTMAVHAYHAKHGSYPPDVAAMSVMGKLPPGTVVASSGLTPTGQFCVQVGADVGSGRAGPPYLWGYPEAHGYEFSSERPSIC
jgi:hypothetical protein